MGEQRFFHTFGVAPSLGWSGVKPVGSLTLTNVRGSRTLYFEGNRERWISAGRMPNATTLLLLSQSRRFWALMNRRSHRGQPRRLTRWYAKQRRKEKG